MSYNKNMWRSGDVITAQKLNNIENGVESYERILIDYIEKDIKSIDIPYGITLIGGRAFAYCGSLTTVNIPSSVTLIASYSFYDCYNLTSVNIPSSVKEIGNDVFSGCTHLTEIYIPSSVTRMGNYTFDRVSNIVINCGFAEGAVSGAPWGATNATINYNVPAPSVN